MRDVSIARLAAGQHGVVHVGQLGLDADAIGRRVASGRLHRLHRGVYAVGHCAISRDGALLAAVLACGEGAVLSHRAAGELWGMLEGEAAAIEVTAPGCRSHPGIRTHRGTLDPRDVTRRHGIAVMTPARTLLALAATISAPRLRRPVRRALAMRRTSIPQLLELTARHGGRRGVARLRTVNAEGHVPTRSELEDVV